MKDEHAIVLDFLENGHPGGKPRPLAQVIGEEYFNLLEVAIRDDVHPIVGDRLYIGDGDRDKVKYITGKISQDKLTANAKSEISYVLKKLVDKNKDKFVKFFNDATPLTPRMHSLELLPGIGKKHMWEIIEERETEDFDSFEDLKKRVKLLPDPEKMLAKRLDKELQGDVKHYLFISPPKDKDNKRR